MVAAALKASTFGNRASLSRHLGMMKLRHDAVKIDSKPIPVMYKLKLSNFTSFIKAMALDVD